MSAYAAPFAYITNAGDDTVSVIDTASDALVGTIPVGSAPYGVAVHPSGTRVYVSNVGGGTVSVIDTTSNTVLTTVAAGGYGIVVHPSGNAVYVSDRTGAISVLDTATNQIVARVPLPSADIGEGLRPQWFTQGALALAITPDGASVVAATIWGSERYPCEVTQLGCRLGVLTFDTSTNAFTAPYVDLFRFAVEPRGLIARPLSVVAYGDAGFAGIGWLVSNLTLLPFSPALGIAQNQGGTRLYVTGGDPYEAGQVAVIDSQIPLIDKVITTIAVGRDPRGISLDPEGRRAYVANHGDDTVSVIDTATNTVVDTIAVGHGPISLGQFVGPENPPITPFPTFTPTATPTATPTPTPCTGDCDGSSSVTVDELVQCVNAALGKDAACSACDANGDGRVTVDELVEAVDHALNGCAGSG